MESARQVLTSAADVSHTSEIDQEQSRFTFEIFTEETLVFLVTKTKLFQYWSRSTLH